MNCSDFDTNFFAQQDLPVTRDVSQPSQPKSHPIVGMRELLMPFKYRRTPIGDLCWLKRRGKQIYRKDIYTCAVNFETRNYEKISQAYVFFTQIFPVIFQFIYDSFIYSPGYFVCLFLLFCPLYIASRFRVYIFFIESYWFFLFYFYFLFLGFFYFFIFYYFLIFFFVLFLFFTAVQFLFYVYLFTYLSFVLICFSFSPSQLLPWSFLIRSVFSKASCISIFCTM